MLPAGYIHLQQWPLTKHGKINKNKLPPPVWKLDERKTFVAPATEIEIAIANIWCEVLGLEKVGIHDNFFEVGGHSLVATIAITRIQNHFDTNIPLSEIFRAPTIASIAKYIQIGLKLKQQLSSPDQDNPNDEEVII